MIRIIKSQSSELRFYAEDGWNEEVLLSCLAIGELISLHHDRTKKLFWTLSRSATVAAFDIARLMDFMPIIIGFDGREIAPERHKFYLQSFAQRGVFDHGE